MDPILNALDKLRDELSKALSNQTFRPAAVPAAASPFKEDGEEFTYTDPDGDVVEAYPVTWSSGVTDCVLLLGVSPQGQEDVGPSVYLSQGAVNALARYLDQHRTDRPTAGPEPVHVKGRARCASLRPALMDQCELDTEHTGTHRYGTAQWVNAPARCDRARVGIGRCELDTGHAGTHRYCGAEWVSTFDEPAPREHWCGKGHDHGVHNHGTTPDVMHCLGSYNGVYGAVSPAVSDACPSRYSNAGGDDEDQACEKTIGHRGSHRAENELAAYAWTDANPRAYTDDKPLPTRDKNSTCTNAGSCVLCDETPKGVSTDG